MKPIGKNVIISQQSEGSYIQLKSGMKIHGDERYKPENFQQERVTVVAIPDHIGRKTGLDHDEENIIRKGDEVIVMMQELLLCDRMGKVFWHNNQKLKIVDYASIMCVIRGDMIIPVNDNLIVKPYTEKKQSEYLSLSDVKMNNKGTVLYASKPSWNYKEKYKNQVSSAFKDVRPGDIITVTPKQIPHLEHPYRLTLSKEMLLVAKRYQIKYLERNGKTFV